jgi:hypothetical protein
VTFLEPECPAEPLRRDGRVAEEVGEIVAGSKGQEHSGDKTGLGHSRTGRGRTLDNLGVVEGRLAPAVATVKCKLRSAPRWGVGQAASPLCGAALERWRHQASPLRPSLAHQRVHSKTARGPAWSGSPQSGRQRSRSSARIAPYCEIICAAAAATAAWQSARVGALKRETQRLYFLPLCN